MNTKQYLESVLEAQTLDSNGDELKKLRSRRREIREILLSAYKSPKPSVRWAGSMSKTTMIRDSYDGDLTCYFDHDDEQAGKTLKEIYESVRDALSDDYLVEEKPSALRILSRQKETKGEYTHIDVVPGRFIEGNDGDVFLFRKSGDKSRLKTNLDVHIEHIRDSGVCDAIRLIKLWRFQNGLDHAKTFVLELLVVDILENKKSLSLQSQLKHVWEEFRDHSASLSVKDPANPEGNALKTQLDDCRDDLASVAKRTLKTIEDDGWEAVFGPVESETEEAKAAALHDAIRNVAVPNKPWLQRD
tara:strand:+ start:30375 stop:31280 length:906 start_codon:yes stop_codon:yes gene_type:complete